MPKKFDLHSALATGVLGRRSAWEFIRGFAAAWSSAPIRDGDGYDGSELAAAEERLGLRLPTALREAYALFGLREDLCGTMHRLQPLDRLSVSPPWNLLSYHVENQGAWACGVRLADLHLDDPPVVHLPPCSCEGHSVHGVAWMERLSMDCIELVLTESFYNTYGTDCHLGIWGELRRDEVSLVDQMFRPLPFPSYPSDSSPCVPGSRWYAGDDLLVCLSPYMYGGELPPGADRGWWHRPGSVADINIRARTPEALEDARKRLPRVWFDWS
ncbi:SMI1/KNR4 family protein [[Actinomadura] parvosata]|nr:SMI1/KNR4 family protein [Nonomuraea sp. ATCC 55076]